MNRKTNFELKEDADFEEYETMKLYILTNLDKQWGSNPRDKNFIPIKIINIIYRNNMSRMDIAFERTNNSSETTQASILEFLDFYHPIDLPLYDACKLLYKKENSNSFAFYYNILTHGK